MVEAVVALVVIGALFALGMRANQRDVEASGVDVTLPPAIADAGDPEFVWLMKGGEYIDGEFVIVKPQIFSSRAAALAVCDRVNAKVQAGAPEHCKGVRVARIHKFPRGTKIAPFGQIIVPNN